MKFKNFDKNCFDNLTQVGLLQRFNQRANFFRIKTDYKITQV